jgi:transcriptional regulator with XRE-family HTH domain
MSDEPLPEALGAILDRRGMTVAGLASLLRAEGLTIGRTRLHQIATGTGPPPTLAQLERLAEALGLSPSYFAEFRLWRARSLLDPSVVGFDRAMSNFARLRGQHDGLAALAPRPSDGRYPDGTSANKETA